MKEDLLLRTLELLPRNAYSRLMGRLAEVPLPPRLREPALRLFARRTGVDLGEVELPLSEYPSLGAFFARRLRAGLRPPDPRPGLVLAPADGHVTQSGALEAGRLLQVKGKDYGVQQLLQDPEMAGRFRGGSYATVYLCPADYHRVHFPCAGRVLGYRYLPGTLYPVNDLATRRIPELFVQNERVTTYLESPEHGLIALVMVGALAVGRMSLAYADLQTNGGPLRVPTRRSFEPALEVAAGAELGTFHLGSTVVLLCETAGLRSALPAGAEVRMGQALLQR